MLPPYFTCVLQSEEGGAAEQLRKVQAFVEELKDAANSGADGRGE